jgi:hypothetical protein
VVQAEVVGAGRELPLDAVEINDSFLRARPQGHSGQVTSSADAENGIRFSKEAPHD